MILSAILAATFTFTATATGIDRGAPVEFVFVGKNSDRDYEAMFLLDEPIGRFCRRIEEAGLPRGKPVNQESCQLWPCGCALQIDPPISNFVNGAVQEGEPPALIYTGGTRTESGFCEAATEMPAALLSVYTLAQSPIVFDGIFDQGEVYGRLTAEQTLEKGKRYTFTVTWDASKAPRHLDLTLKKGTAADILKILKTQSESGNLDVCVGFEEDVSIAEATAFAQALATIDSARVKINGCKNIFYRAFLPLVKWRDRQERLHQPYELNLEPDGSEKFVFIDEDWSVEGDDPKLTPQEIPYADAAKHPQTDTCFIYAKKNETVGRLVKVMDKLKGSAIRNWYVFSR